jgi:hypothetical protein
MVPELNVNELGNKTGIYLMEFALLNLVFNH